jgi:excisionase family DNA binding protein
MTDRPLSVAEAAKMIPFVSEGTLYRWVRSGEVKAERAPGGRMKIRESEVRRINAWYEGVAGGQNEQLSDGMSNV